MIEKAALKDYAGKLMFDMKDEEYETLQQEFEVILKQMDLISRIEGIADVAPMTFPFVTYRAELRPDVVREEDVLTPEDVLLNAKSYENDMVRVPKVVE